MVTVLSNNGLIFCLTRSSKRGTNVPEWPVLTARQTRRLCGDETTTENQCVTLVVSISNCTT